ncbi:MAG: LysR family transcriptional regulator [Hoeflea sp. D1-CHI-28]
MNIEHARTFLAVSDTGSFVAAANLLHITQSTVSARIRALEQLLGTRLFTRSKAGAVPTHDGERFMSHAGQMVRALEQAQREIGLPRRFAARINIGARIGLWEAFLTPWLADISVTRPDLSFRAKIGFEPDLMQGIVDGRLDIAAMYTPQRRPNLELLPLFTERLVMVTSDPGGDMVPKAYIHVDWGQEFSDQFTASFTGFPSPFLSVNIGWLGLQYLIQSQGCGYFPKRLVDRHVRNGTLRLVSSAPVFDLPAWLLIREERDVEVIDPIIAELCSTRRSKTWPEKRRRRHVD